MSSVSDVARGLAFAAKSGRELIDEQSTQEEHSGLNHFLDLLNRGTEASASVFDELLFEPIPNPMQAWLDGVRGEGRAYNFGEVSKHAGWNPRTKAGKTAKFLLTLAPDIGLDPTTYFSFGAAPLAKHLPKAGKLLKSGKGVKEITKVYGKGTGKAAELIRRAQMFKDPKVDEVMAKLLKGEDLTLLEESTLGARTVFGLQSPFGQTLINPVPRDASVKFYTHMQKVNSWLDTNQFTSPVIHGFGKAFNSFYDLKRKAPEFFKLRRSRDQKINYATAQGFQRAIQSISKLATADERKLITELMEMPDENIVARSFFKDITPLIDDVHPGFWDDLGIKDQHNLNEEESVELVNHWLNNVNKWINEFGDDGIMDQRALKDRMEVVGEEIRVKNAEVGEIQRTLDEMPQTQPTDAPDVESVADALKKELDRAIAELDELTKIHGAAKDELVKTMVPESRPLSDFDLGAGSFGQVKGRWDILKFRNHVIKLPVALDSESFGSIVVEAKVYKALEGIPGVGRAKLVWKEMPLDDAVAHQDALFPKTFGPLGVDTGVPVGGKIVGGATPSTPSVVSFADMGLQDLVESGFVITKADGKRYLKVPHLVKRLIDIDKEATRAFHGPGGNAHWNMPVKALRDFEKILTRASQQGVHLSDLQSGNLVIDKLGKVHLLDLGYGNEINKTAEGLQSSWRRNLLRFADHVVHKTRFTSKEAQARLKPLVDKYITPTGGHMGIRSTGVTPEEVQLIKETLRSVGMPLRHLTEKAATKPLPEGFRRAGLPAVQKFKMHQRKLSGERNLVLSKLSPKAREAFDNVLSWKREMTERLTANGLLTEEWIENFETKFGIPHLRHLKTEEGLVKRFQNAISVALTKKAGTLKARQMEGSIKEIHDRLGREFFETDIARIMFASEVEVTTAVENWKLLNKVADNPDWSRPAIETTRKIKIKRGKYKGEFRDVVQYQPEEGYELVNHPLFEGQMVREEIAEDVNKLITKSRQDMGHQLIKKWYDPAHKWLRAYTLFLFPSYHIRNFAGAVWNNFLADVDVKDHFNAHKVIFGGKKMEKLAEEWRRGAPFELDGIRAPEPNRKLPYKIDGKTMTHQELLNEANEFGVMGRGQMGPHGDIERGLAGDIGGIVPKSKGELAASFLPPIPTTQGLINTAEHNPLIQLGGRVGTQVENVVRLAHYMSKRKEGLSAMDAALSVKKYQFDYQELSEFERNWLKRTFFFYTWTRKNLPLQAQAFLMRPGKFTAGLKAREEVQTQAGGPDPDDKLVPEWLHDQLGMRFRYDKKAGTYEYFLLGSWWPAADLNRIFDPIDELVNMTSPLLKIPIEQAMNKSAFFDQDIERIPGERKEFLSPEAGQVLGNVPGADAISRLLFDAPIEEGVTVPGRAHHLLRQFRPANEVRRWAEAVARGGPELGLVNSLIGKSYEFNPDRARKGKDYEIKMQIGLLKSQLRKAQKRGKASEARKLMQEIRRLQEELIR